MCSFVENVLLETYAEGVPMNVEFLRRQCRDAGGVQAAAHVAADRHIGAQANANRIHKQMQDAFGNINLYPTLFLVDAGGVIQKHYVNYQPYETLAQDVESAVSSGPK